MIPACCHDRGRSKGRRDDIAKEEGEQTAPRRVPGHHDQHARESLWRSTLAQGSLTGHFYCRKAGSVSSSRPMPRTHPVRSSQQHTLLALWRRRVWGISQNALAVTPKNFTPACCPSDMIATSISMSPSLSLSVRFNVHVSPYIRTFFTGLNLWCFAVRIGRDVEVVVPVCRVAGLLAAGIGLSRLLPLGMGTY